MKPCKRYGHVLGRDRDGHCSECRRISNRDSYTRQTEEGRLTKIASTRAWEKRNPELARAYKNNTEIIRRERFDSALSNMHRKELNRIYAECPPGHHVDHIYPLNGKNSSGLHVPINLQYLPALDNLKKSNRCPEIQ